MLYEQDPLPQYTIHTIESPVTWESVVFDRGYLEPWEISTIQACWPGVWEFYPDGSGSQVKPGPTIDDVFELLSHATGG